MHNIMLNALLNANEPKYYRTHTDSMYNLQAVST